MGVDIHLNIIDKNGNIKYQDFFEGRNTEWFNYMYGESGNEIYDNLDIKYGIPKNCKGKIKEDYDKPRDWGYYNFRYIILKDFWDWFYKYKPDVDAGWVNTYDKWRIENKGVYPEEILHYKPDKELRIEKHGDEEIRYMSQEEYYFVEIKDKYDCSAWLINFIAMHNDIEDDDIIVYYFDC